STARPSGSTSDSARMRRWCASPSPPASSTPEKPPAYPPPPAIPAPPPRMPAPRPRAYLPCFMPTSTRECSSCRTQLPAEAQFCFRCGHATPTEPGVPPRTTPTGEIEVTRVRELLAERYRIERVVGEGGMATVYLAEDLKHH